MFVDFEELSSGETHALEADICIIGGGAAGISLATEFVGHPTSVLLLESGNFAPEKETTALYDSRMAAGGKNHASTLEGRARTFGGTTTLWGGQALPLEAIDFEPRDWVNESGWPFGGDELTPFRARAGAKLGLNDVVFDRDFHALFRVPRPGFDPAVATHIYSRWSPQPNFKIRYRSSLSASENIRVLLHANVTQIVPAPDGSQIDHVEIKSFGGRHATVRAKAYIVCCGGIETARLLLASNRVQPAGLGNGHDLVGRYFQDHLTARWADFLPANRRVVDNLFNSFFWGGQKYYPLLAASEALQRELNILNISAAVVMNLPAESGVEVARRVRSAVIGRRWRDLSMADCVKLIGQAPELARMAWRYAVQHRSYANFREPLFLGSTIEQEPCAQSRVTLGSETDELGMPRTVVDWRMTPLVGTTLRSFARRLKPEFERLGLGEVRLHPWVMDEEADWLGKMQDVSHHIGTTRMHDHPRHGVVDAQCRVHGLTNLYVNSSAVFPTGGHSNPTYTVLMLTLRLADRLKQTLR